MPSLADRGDLREQVRQPADEIEQPLADRADVGDVEAGRSRRAGARSTSSSRRSITGTTRYTLSSGDSGEGAAQPRGPDPLGDGRPAELVQPLRRARGRVDEQQPVRGGPCVRLFEHPQVHRQVDRWRRSCRQRDDRPERTAAEQLGTDRTARPSRRDRRRHHQDGPATGAPRCARQCWTQAQLGLPLRRQPVDPPAVVLEFLEAPAPHVEGRVADERRRRRCRRRRRHGSSRRRGPRPGRLGTPAWRRRARRDQDRSPARAPGRLPGPRGAATPVPHAGSSTLPDVTSASSTISAASSEDVVASCRECASTYRRSSLSYASSGPVSERVRRALAGARRRAEVRAAPAR